MRFSDRKAIDDRVYDYLTRTGWEKCDRNYDAAVYSIRILEGYYTNVYAFISVDEEGLSVDGDLGVRFLEGEYEYKDRALCEYDLKCIEGALWTAEDLLLTIGIPFVKDYQFHGKDKANKARKNLRLRKEWDIENCIKELQKMDGEAAKPVYSREKRKTAIEILEMILGKDDGDTYSEIENEIIEKYGLQDYVKDMYGG